MRGVKWWILATIQRCLSGPTDSITVVWVPHYRSDGIKHFISGVRNLLGDLHGLRMLMMMVMAMASPRWWSVVGAFECLHVRWVIGCAFLCVIIWWVNISEKINISAMVYYDMIYHFWWCLYDVFLFRVRYFCFKRTYEFARNYMKHFWHCVLHANVSSCCMTVTNLLFD